MIDSHPKKESRRKTSKNPKTWYLNTSIKKKKVPNTPLDSPSISKKKKDCRGDCCQSKVILDKGYTTRSITSKKIAITLLSIDRGSIDTKPWIGYLDAGGPTFCERFRVFPVWNLRIIDPRSVYTGDPLSDSRGSVSPDNGRSRCDHGRRNRWTRETTPPRIPSSRSLDGRIKADDDDDVGSWEKGLILAKRAIHSHGC